MASMTISLPEAMKEWVERQARSGRYRNASDYVRDLIRKDQDRLTKIAEMQKVVDARLASGTTSDSITDILATAKRRLAARPQ